MQEITLLNYGRAEPRKGIDILLKSVRILLDRGISIKTYIASPVFYYTKFEKTLKTYEELDLFKNVHFIHKINDDQIQELVNLSDLFVMPSIKYETFGLTIIECLSRGLPVVGTPIGAIPEILTKVDKNLITKDLKPESLADTINWFCNLDDKERKKLSKKSKETVRSHYSQEIVGKKLMTIYKDLLSKNQ